MTTLDTLTTVDFPHGSPAGFAQGCRSAGGCAHHGSAVYLTCKEAASARASDWDLSRLPVDQPILRAALVIPRTPARTAPAEPQTKKPSPAPRAKAPRSSRPAPKPAAPRKPRPAAVAPTPAPAAAAAATPEHGTLAGYWEGGCFREDTCPADPSCAQANLAHQAGIDPKPLRAPREPAAVKPQRQPRKPAGPKPPRAKREPVHGTVWGYRAGCRTEADCPNLSKGEPTCAAAHKKYYSDYRASRRAGNGPPIKHGTPSGYQLGCHDRDNCPGNEDGLSCADASLAEERRRRREAGKPERRPLVNAQPARDHVSYLRSQGMGIVSIAQAAGVSKTGLRALVYGREDFTKDGGHGPRHGELPKNIDQEKAEKILSVEPFNPRATSSAIHGTRNGYRRFKCRSQTDCPAIAEGGISCYEANSRYQSATRQRAARNQAAGASR